MVELTGSIGDNGFDARARTGERVFGRTNCAASAPVRHRAVAAT
jgi:hypothetical protein